MNGLKLEPGWRHACVTWLNLFLLKSKPPTSARIAPSCGVSDTSAPSTCGSCVICQLPFASATTRTIEPGLMRCACVARGLNAAATKRSPSPLIVATVPSTNCAFTSFGVADVTTAATISPLSG